MEYGLVGLFQPYMDAANGYCNFECTQCSEVCPNSAILPLTVEEKKLTQIGIVKFIKENCVVYTDETLCGACSEHCPTKAVKMIRYKEKLNIPEVETDICIGCGACEHACPVRPHRAIYVDGNAVHQVAKAPKEEKLEQQKLEEFPF
jgi:ferredoxin